MGREGCEEKNFASGIYCGWVRHRRETPAKNAFKYQVAMMYLDLSEIKKVFALSPFFGFSAFSIARFKRSDFHRPEVDDIYQAVADTVEQQTGSRPRGPIRVLANLRYWGYNTNPLTTYYCFDESGEKLETIVAEVTNTPWGESHAYVIEQNDVSRTYSFAKKMHVSPFNPLSMSYLWRASIPGRNLTIHIENWQNQQKVMDATLVLKKKPISAQTLNGVLVQYPIMTVKVIAAIYWQAMKLWMKKVPYLPHPHNKHQRASVVTKLSETVK